MPMNSKRNVPVTERSAAAVLVAAAGLMAAGASIGAFAPSLREAPWSDDPQRLAQAIAGNPGAFVWANTLFLAATISTSLALVTVGVRFDRGARPWALAGLGAFFFAAVFEVFARLMSISIFPWAAQQNVNPTEFAAQAFIRLDDALSEGFFALAFLALGLFGVALTRRGSHGRLGWPFVAGAVLGIVLQLVGAMIPAFVFLGTAALGAAIWFYGAGHDDGH